MSAIIGETVTMGQANGPDVQLCVTGDEFYAVHETTDGYAAVNDTTLGLFCYGRLENGALVSSGVPIGALPPTGTERHLRETPEARRGRTVMLNRPANSSSARKAGAPALVRGVNNGLLEGRRLSSGTVRGLTILVDFQDIKTSVTVQEIDAMLNGQNYTANGNHCSVRDYFLTVSSNKLDYRNDVVGPILLSRNRDYYVGRFPEFEAMDLVVASGLDLRAYDSLHDGTVDVVNIMYAGPTQYSGGLWPRTHRYRRDYGDFHTQQFVVCSAGSSSAEQSIGTFCHETGHALCCFPDLYDYGNGDGDVVPSMGIGMYCAMGTGQHNFSGRRPSPMCAYLRDLVGWCDTEISLNSAGDFEAVHAAYDTALKFRTDTPNEYFLVENRSRYGLDFGLHASGLAVYHCDTLGSNELQQGSADQHYQCALLQADGRFELEKNLNRGNGLDLFSSNTGTEVSRDTTPSTRLWNGADSGLAISDVGASAERMRFRVRPDTRAIVVWATSAQPIVRSGPASRILIAQVGTVGKLKVAVDLTHPHIGNLTIDLLSPAGDSVRLHNLEGGGADSLWVTYDSTESLSPLARFAGQAMRGNWTLSIADLGGGSAAGGSPAMSHGVLNKWSLMIIPVT
jgi:M6 family metalloprotease-like protein